MGQTVALLMAYKYAIMFPLSVVEGPIITIIAGFLSKTGVFNPLFVYIVVVAGDMIGDSLYYGIGRWGEGFVHRHAHRIGATPEKIAQAKDYFQDNHLRAMIGSKLIHGVGTTGLIVAGLVRVPYFRFVRTCFVITLLQSAVLLAIGILFGQAYEQIGQYLNEYAAIVSAIVVLGIATFVVYKYKFLSFR